MDREETRAWYAATQDQNLAHAIDNLKSSTVSFAMSLTEDNPDERSMVLSGGVVAPLGPQDVRTVIDFLILVHTELGKIIDKIVVDNMPKPPGVSMMIVDEDTTLPDVLRAILGLEEDEHDQQG